MSTRAPSGHVTDRDGESLGIDTTAARQNRNVCTVNCVVRQRVTIRGANRRKADSGGADSNHISNTEGGS